jgi:hypothetical protein
MKLSVVERLKVLEILPRAGNVATMRIVAELRKALSFKEDEHIEFGIETKEPGHCATCGYVGFAAPDDSCPQSVPKEKGKKPECLESSFIKDGQQNVYWNVEAERDVEIDIDVESMGVIVTALNELSERGEVAEQHVSLYDKFIGE